jgi:hypothetical protein
VAQFETKSERMANKMITRPFSTVDAAWVNEFKNIHALLFPADLCENFFELVDEQY